MQDDESRVHETVKSVYPYETGEETICEYVRATVKADLAGKFSSGHTGCLSTAVVEAIAANIYFDRKKYLRMTVPAQMCICRIMQAILLMRWHLRKTERSSGWSTAVTMPCHPVFQV